MACGCGGGGNRNAINNSKKSKIVATPRANIAPSTSSAEQVNIPEPQNLSDSDRKRINKLRSEAIARSLGKIF